LGLQPRRLFFWLDETASTRSPEPVEKELFRSRWGHSLLRNRNPRGVAQRYCRPVAPPTGRESQPEVRVPSAERRDYGRSVPQEGGTSSLRAPAHHWETSRNHGGPARRSAAGPTLHPAQPQKGIGPDLKGAARIQNKFMQYGGGLSVSVITVAELKVWQLRSLLGTAKSQAIVEMYQGMQLLDVGREVAIRYAEI